MIRPSLSLSCGPALLALSVWLSPLKEASAAHPTAQVDQVFASWNRPDSPGASVVIVKDGVVVHQKGYGCADLEHQAPITEKTVFDVASVAKQFTGMAVAMLVKDGKLSLKDDVHKYLPDLPDFGETITVGHLVWHTSGVRDWCEVFLLSGKDTGDLLTLDMILEMARHQQHLDFHPGTEYQYSNTGYNLLAAVVTKVTGQTFRVWTKEHLFAPLGMKHTFAADDPAEVVPNRALSYTPAGSKAWRHNPSRLSALGSSSLFTTAEDMGKWLVNFDSGKVAGKDVLKEMIQPGTLNNGKPVQYGFGLVTRKYRGLTTIEHSGSWTGYRSKVLLIPDHRFGVAILANASSLDCSDLARKISDIYVQCPPESGPKRVEATASGKPDPTLWDFYIGTYRLGPGWLLTISRDGDQLMVQATREDKFQMTALSEREFFVKAYGAPVIFNREGSGPATHLDYRGIHAPRLILPETTPDYLGAYTGDYWSEELRVGCRVQVRNGELQTWHPLAGWVSLLPTGPDQFDTHSGFAIHFVRDSQGQLNALRISGSRVRNLRFIKTTFPRN